MATGLRALILRCARLGRSKVDLDDVRVRVTREPRNHEPVPTQGRFPYVPNGFTGGEAVERYLNLERLLVEVHVAGYDESDVGLGGDAGSTVDVTAVVIVDIRQGGAEPVEHGVAIEIPYVARAGAEVDGVGEAADHHQSRVRRRRSRWSLVRCPFGVERVGHPGPTRQHLDDDAADHLTRLHGPEGVVDLVELDATRHHRTDVEPPGLHEADKPREVPPNLSRAVQATEDLLLVVEQRKAGEGHLAFSPGHPDHDDRAAPPGYGVGLLNRLGQTDHLEGVVGSPPAGEVLDLGNGIAGRRVDQVGRAELLARLALQLDRVHCDDAGRPRDAGALDHRLAHTPAADHHDR